LQATIALSVGKAALALTAIGLFGLLSMAAYFVAEDGPCWMGTIWC
jgi:hypothetical protein